MPASNDSAADGDDRGDLADRSPTDHAVAVFAPALLLLIEVHRTGDGRDEVHLHAGGQGYWVSRMIQALGARPIPCATIGGESGHALRAIIAADGLDARLTAMEHANAVLIDDRRDGARQMIAETTIPSLGRHEVDELYSSIVGAAMSAGVCVLAGTQLSPMFDTDTFRRLVADLRRNDVTVICDLHGAPLRAALDSGVDVVKLSHEELISDGWADRNAAAAIADGIARLRRRGAGAVVVSRQHRATLAGYDDQVVEVRSPSLEVLDGRGGGDSMTAAIAVAAARRLPFEDGLRIAAAAAALNVSRHGLGTGRRDSIEDVAAHVAIRPVSRPAGGDRADLGEMTRDELYQLAKRLDIAGRSSMKRDELIAAVGRASAEARVSSPA